MDPRVAQYHAVRFGICTPLAVSHLCAAPPRGLAFAQYLGWYLVYGRASLEWIAGLMGIQLERPSDPDELPSARTPAFDSLLAAVEPATKDDSFAAFEQESAWRVAIYLARADRYGASVFAADTTEANALLGRSETQSPPDDGELEKFVLSADPGHDEVLLRFLHRRLLREEFLLSPAMRELQNIEIPRLV